MYLYIDGNDPKRENMVMLDFQRGENCWSTSADGLEKDGIQYTSERVHLRMEPGCRSRVTEQNTE